MIAVACRISAVNHMDDVVEFRKNFENELQLLN